MIGSAGAMYVRVFFYMYVRMRVFYDMHVCTCLLLYV